MPRPVTENDRDIELIRDPWFEEAFSQTSQSIAANEPLRGASTRGPDPAPRVCHLGFTSPQTLDTAHVRVLAVCTLVVLAHHHQ